MTVPCPRCGAPVPEPGAGAPVTTTCVSCGLAMATEYLREGLELGRWHDWAGQRLAWLHDRLLAGDRPGAMPAAPGPGPAAAPYPAAARRPATTGSLLLAAGAFLLVVAGIAFLAFTWDLLGPLGQVAVLLVLGATCLAAARGLLGRLHGTALTLGVVGTLLVTIAAIGVRSLGPDVVGATGAMIASVVIAVALCGAGAWLRPRAAAVGELAGVLGALLTLAVLATAPADAAVPVPDPWWWWVAMVCAIGSLLLLLLADRVGLRGWPWVAAGSLSVAVVAVAGLVLELVDDSLVRDAGSVVVAGVLVVGAAVLALAARGLPHRGAVTGAALALWGLAVVLAWCLTVAPLRPWAALVLVGAGAVALVVLDPRVPVPRGLVAVAGTITCGGAAGLLVAPWADPSGYATVAAWAVAAWPVWRGAVSGLAFVVVLAGTAVLLPRLLSARDEPGSGPATPDGWRGVVVLLPAAAALGTWLVTSVADLDAVAYKAYSYQPEPAPVAYQHQVAVALAILAAGLLVGALVRRLANWSVWVACLLGAAAGLVELGTRDLGAWRPEAYGAVLAAPTLLAAMGWSWLRRPGPTSTWQTIAPVLSLAVAPSTLALLADAGGRWSGEDPGMAYQLRMVGLLGVGLCAAVVGAWRRWAGAFFPGLILTVAVVVAELVDLGRFLPQWVAFGLAGALLVAAGARWEWLRGQGRAGAAWARGLR